MKIRAFHLAFPLIIGVFAGCNDGGSGGDCQTGTFLCPCLDGICQVGLVCENNACVPGADDSTSGPGDGDGDGDPGDGDPGDGDPGDGDPGDGDGDGDGDTGDPLADDDNDGLPNGSDNCPNDSNPNQLDFDNNGQGNVCDVLEFTNVSGTLTMEVVTDFVSSCSPVFPLEVESGHVSLRFDDQANSVGIVISEVAFAPFHSLCANGFDDVDWLFPDLAFSYDGQIPYPVSMAHSMAAHDAGNVAGMSSNPHMMTATSLLDTDSQLGLVPTSHNYSSNGSWPIFTLNVMSAGDFGTMNWNAPNLDVTPVEMYLFTEPFAPDQSVQVNFEDLSGTLELLP